MSKIYTAYYLNIIHTYIYQVLKKVSIKHSGLKITLTTNPKKKTQKNRSDILFLLLFILLYTFFLYCNKQHAGWKSNMVTDYEKR